MNKMLAAVSCLLLLAFAGCATLPEKPVEGLAHCALARQWQSLPNNGFSVKGVDGGVGYELLFYPELSGQSIMAVGITPVGVKAFSVQVTADDIQAKHTLLMNNPRYGLPLITDWLLAWGPIAEVNACLPQGLHMKATANQRILQKSAKPWLVIEFDESKKTATFSDVKQQDTWSMMHL